MMPAVGATGAVARRGSTSSTPCRASSPRPAGPAVADPRGRRVADRDAVYDENRIVVPLTKIAPIMRQAPGGDRGHPLLRARRRRPAGRGPALVSNRPAAATPRAARRSPSSTSRSSCWSRPCTRRHEAAAGGRRAAGPAGYSRKLQELRYAIALEKKLTKDQILAGLPQHRLLRRPGLRRRGRRPALLRRQRRKPHPAPGRDARRAWSSTPGHDPVNNPERRAPGATSCSTGCSSSA